MFDLDAMPTLDASDWPEERVRKALRNYAMQYVRNLLPEIVRVFGPLEGANLGRSAARLIGMQYYRETAEMLGVTQTGPSGFAAFMTALGAGQGDEMSTEEAGGTLVVRQHTWKLMRRVAPLDDAVFEAWNGLWEGALAVHDRSLHLAVTRRLDRGDNCFEWRLGR